MFIPLQITIVTETDKQDATLNNFNKRQKMNEDDKIKKSKGKEYTGQFKKGCVGGPGRPKGSENKVTKETREFMKELQEATQTEARESILKLAKDDPDKFMNRWLTMAEFNTPKLQRTEITGADSGPVQLYLVDRIKDPEAEDDESE